MEQNKYIKFKYEDFLQDPYFLESMKTPSDESIAFWEKAKQTFKRI